LIGERNLFRDSCVFIRYLTREPTNGLDDIDSFVADTKRRLSRLGFLWDGVPFPGGLMA